MMMYSELTKVFFLNSTFFIWNNVVQFFPMCELNDLMCIPQQEKQRFYVITFLRKFVKNADLVDEANHIYLQDSSLFTDEFFKKIMMCMVSYFETLFTNVFKWWTYYTFI